METWIGEFHPILVHFPIVLFTLTLVADILGHYKLPNAFLLGSWLLWAGTVIAIPVLITGWEASESIPEDNLYLYPHMYRAFGLASYALIYSIFRWVIIWKKLDFAAFIYIFLSLILLFLTSITAEYGGIISHGVSPFSTIYSPSS